MLSSSTFRGKHALQPSNSTPSYVHTLSLDAHILVYQGNVFENVHSSIVPNTLKLEAPQMSINSGMDK